MKLTLRTSGLLGIIGVSAAWAQAAVVFTENMGTPSGTTSIALNTFQNSGTLSYSGTGDVRISTASTGYTGSSGSGNVFLTNNGTASFTISSINVSGYTAGSLDISFGAFKSTIASNFSELSFQYSTDGTSYSSLSIPTQPTGSGTANWRLINVDGASIGATSTLYLRWTNTGTSPQFRIDDVILTGVAIPEPASFAASAGIGALGFFALRRRRSLMASEK